MDKKKFKKELKKAIDKGQSKSLKVPIEIRIKDFDKLIEEKIEAKFKKIPDSFKIQNWPESMKVEKPEWYKEPAEKVEVKNWPKPQKFPDIKIPEHPKEIAIKKPKWYQKIKLVKAVADIVSGIASALDRHKQPENAFAVKLTTGDGKRFYNAFVTAVATGAPDPVGIKDAAGNTINPVERASTPTIYNNQVANTLEASQALPAGTKKFRIFAMNNTRTGFHSDILRVYFATAAAAYIPVPVANYYDIDNINAAGLTVYYRSATANYYVIIVAWA